MSVLRSPSNTATGGGSQPDLSKISGMEMDSTITFRKRKLEDHDCNCSGEIRELRSEITRMTAILEKYTSSNELMMNKMQEKITEVKTELTEVQSQVNDIKSSSLNFTMEQNSIKAKVTTLEKSLSSLQSTLEKASSSGKFEAEIQDNISEKLYREVQERNEREKNVIIVGLPEQTSSSAEERISKDLSDVLKITGAIDKNIAKPIKIIRIGKFNPNKSRRIKVCYETNIPVKLLLRHKIKLPENIKLYSDQTPTQYKYLQNVKDELARRKAKGELNLTIKYIQGIPSIIELPPKNL